MTNVHDNEKKYYVGMELNQNNSSGMESNLSRSAGMASTTK